jgi:hypothetical protein
MALPCSPSLSSLTSPKKWTIYGFLLLTVLQRQNERQRGIIRIGPTARVYPITLLLAYILYVS